MKSAEQVIGLGWHLEYHARIGKEGRPTSGRDIRRVKHSLDVELEHRCHCASVIERRIYPSKAKTPLMLYNTCFILYTDYNTDHDIHKS